MTSTDHLARSAAGRRAGLLRDRLAAVVVACLACGPAAAATFEEAEGLFRVGQYEACSRVAGEELDRVRWGDQWSVLKIQADMAVGDYAAALAALEAGLERAPTSLRLRLFGRDVYRFNGRDADAAAAPAEIETLIRRAPQRYASVEGRVALGRYFLTRGADARKVLDQFYDVARKADPTSAEAYFATAELAIEKQDDAVAAETLRGGPEPLAEDPRYHYLLAVAFSGSDRSQAAASLEAALGINPRHVDSLLLRADGLIDAEKFEAADEVLNRVLAVNPHEPRAWAFRAVLAHLRNDPDGEAAARESALSRWGGNPEVDHLIGRKLSQKYRFKEGAEAQRRSLELDPGYRPAKFQLCQDLLRLGREEEGWELADAVTAEDGYNVVGFNLVTLRDEIEGYRVLREDGFIVRMEGREAELYGGRVLALLRDARDRLGSKYQVSISDPVTVEIFPRQRDFAVRTFGLPGADGFLGVCFGNVITVNGPAAQGANPFNWESVLWHEYCHAVTLTKTRNRMPRWLSEGLSVYEEGLRDPACEMAMSPEFREMLLGEDFTPLSELSSAFLTPKSPLHVQFAYYESSLAAEFLIERFGLPTLLGLLDDLGAGRVLNDALVERAGVSLGAIDDEFRAFARSRAEAAAPDATWQKPDLPPSADSAAVERWVEQHPDSFPGMRRLGATLAAEGRWEAARDAAERLTRLYPEDVGPGNGYRLLATALRHLGDVKAERKALEDLIARDSDATEAYERLMELDAAASSWEAVAKNAERFLAVNPLVAAPHRRLAEASEALNRRDEAVAAYRSLALLDDTDPAETHFRLARLLHSLGRVRDARRETLKSLEEAPRYTAAQRLLLEIVDRSGSASGDGRRAPIEAGKP